MRRLFSSRLAKHILIGLALGLWGFFYWASFHASMTGHALFFRDRDLALWQIALASIFRLFEQPQWMLATSTLFIIVTLALVWTGLSDRPVSRRLPRIVHFAVIFGLTGYFGRSSVFYLASEKFIPPESGIPFFSGGWFVVIWEALSLSLVIVPFMLLVLEYPISAAEKVSLTIPRILQRWLGITVLWTLTAVACVTLSLYSVRSSVVAILEFSDYFVRLPGFLCLGALFSFIPWAYAKLLNSPSWGKIGVFTAMALGWSLTLSAPAIWYIQANIPQEHDFPSVPHIVRSQLLASDQGFGIHMSVHGQDGTKDQQADLWPAEPPVTKRRFHSDERMPVLPVKYYDYSNYPEFREYFLKATQSEPYSISSDAVSALRSGSEKDPFLSRDDAGALFNAFMASKDANQSSQWRYIEFAYWHGLPEADAALQDYKTRLGRLNGLFPQGQARSSNTTYFSQELQEAKTNAFSEARVGRVHGRIALVGDILAPGADLRRAWVSVAPRFQRMHADYPAYASTVTHFPLQSDGAFELKGLPYRNYRLLVDIPSDLFRDPLDVSIIDFPPEITITPEVPNSDLGTVRFGKSIRFLSPNLEEKGMTTPTSISFVAVPGAIRYEVLYCRVFMGVVQTTAATLVNWPWGNPGSGPCRIQRAGEMAPQIIRATTFISKFASGHFQPIIRAIGRDGSYLASSMPLFYKPFLEREERLNRVHAANQSRK